MPAERAGSAKRLGGWRNMAEDTSTAAPPEHDGTTDERLTAVENGIERLTHAVERLIPGSHADAQQHTETRLDRASTVEDQVRAELARARQEEADADAAQQADAAGKADADSVKERLARLEEKPPAPPRLRRVKLLGWGDGRS